MIKAYRMQDMARAVGFDWDKKEDVWNKVKEEIAELEVEMNTMVALQKSTEATQQQKDEAVSRAQCELGDLFFSLVNAARLYKLEPDTALESTNSKFRNRFTYLEQETIRKGRSLKEMTLEEMDAIWNEAKAKGL